MQDDICPCRGFLVVATHVKLWLNTFIGQGKKEMKRKILKPRLPAEAVTKLRSGGGPHSTPKGKKGYDRKQEKKTLQKESASEKEIK